MTEEKERRIKIGDKVTIHGEVTDIQRVGFYSVVVEIKTRVGDELLVSQGDVELEKEDEL